MPFDYQYKIKRIITMDIYSAYKPETDDQSGEFHAKGEPRPKKHQNEECIEG